MSYRGEEQNQLRTFHSPAGARCASHGKFTTTNRSSAMTPPVQTFLYRYAWGMRYPRTLDRKGQECRVLVRGGRNSALVEYADGYKAVISRNALRRRDG